ncbi:Lon protease-like protein 2 [Chytriomyces hyalinus]|nr:Lon protease-like protein 2 [Chytriomyces hyalinus]
MPEHQLFESILERMSEMSWDIMSDSDSENVQKAKMQLDADHFGMDGVKKRVLEYLAVGKLKKDLKGPILCLIGPIGVCKTSLGKSVANELGRKFYRISLGVVRDEAEILILIDEIDKLTRDARGRPSAALLEVFEAEQSNTFTDYYMSGPFDLSQAVFIASANEADTISASLLD